MPTLINPPNYEFANGLTGDQDDVVIAVMGVIGAGKSSFIKLLTGDTSIKIGDDLGSETSDVQIIHFHDPDSGRKVTFVDTPGFDDSRGSDDSSGLGDSRPTFSDTDILKRIADFLLKEYDQKRKLSGLIYVQRISDPRFSGQSARNLRMFRELCGPEAFKKVVVLTTHWDQVPTPGVGDQREAQLKARFFAKLLEGGAQFMRHDRTVESARKVLRHILPLPTISLMQPSWSVHSNEVEKALANYKREIADLIAEMATVKKSNDAARRELEKELNGLRDSLASREREQAGLKKDLDEERDLRKRLERDADELRAQLLQSLSKEGHLTASGHQDDIVIAVMGVTGAGKSSFIKLLTGDTSVKIGDGLDSETSEVQILHFRDPDSGRKVTCLDTPGFDDSRGFDDSPGSDDSAGLDDSRPTFSDTDILKRIANFLLQEYDENRKLSGLIYVQRISDPRFSGQSSRNLRMFRELCGPEAYKNVVVLTTYWDQVPSHETGVRREEQLKSRFFANLVEGGAQFMQHDRTVESTRKVLRHILPMPPTITQIQTEMGKEGKSLIKTAAGSVHSKEVEKSLANYKREIADLTAEMATIKESNHAARRGLEKELTGLRNSLARREQEQAELKKGLDEERELRKRLEKSADDYRRMREARESIERPMTKTSLITERGTPRGLRT